MAAKVLQLRSSDGKVLVAPAWDYRPAAAQDRPLETRVPSRVLARVLGPSTTLPRPPVSPGSPSPAGTPTSSAVSRKTASPRRPPQPPKNSAATASTMEGVPIATPPRPHLMSLLLPRRPVLIPSVSGVSTTENASMRRRCPAPSRPLILPPPRALGLPPPCRPLLVLTPSTSGAPSVPVDARWLKTRSPLATTASTRIPSLALRSACLPLLLRL
ncbi:hypothetical protein CFC21_015756 [Triticum aestivum]|uniref:Uncharacterized protein n=3 Tax=Triticum TaxID=4564 RepID=A0A9R1DX58_WHEAT|nr:hypothetical protein CFC21_015755 [Triticum aestivum]KAF6999781.1 hypothetical protein CFC21_015756 [Triticum aestivum]VAH27342.1 unnamed protein product [Triticum turgidum subsp. durum]